MFFLLPEDSVAYITVALATEQKERGNWESLNEDLQTICKVFITPNFTSLEQWQNKALLAAKNKDKKFYVIK